MSRPSPAGRRPRARLQAPSGKQAAPHKIDHVLDQWLDEQMWGQQKQGRQQTDRQAERRAQASSAPGGTSSAVQAARGADALLHGVLADLEC